MFRYLTLVPAILFSLVCYAQFGGDDQYLRLSGGFGSGSGKTEIVWLNQINPTTFSISPGSHFSGEIAYGKSLYQNFYGELALSYLYSPENGELNGLPFGQLFTPNFTRIGLGFTFKYSFPIVDEKLALAPTLGFSVLFAGSAKFESYEIKYNSGFGFQPGLEVQWKLSRKFLLNGGVKYRFENYGLSTFSHGEITELSDEAKRLNANGVQLHIGIAFVLVQKNIMGRRI